MQKLRHEGLDVAPDGVMLLRKRGGQRDGDGFMVSYGPMVPLVRRNIQPYYLNVNRGGS